MSARYEWALNHKEWTDCQWDSVIFINESTLTVRPAVLKKRIQSKPNTKYKLCNLVPTFKSGYVSICIWGAFPALGRTPLIRINRTLKQD